MLSDECFPQDYCHEKFTLTHSERTHLKCNCINKTHAVVCNLGNSQERKKKDFKLFNEGPDQNVAYTTLFVSVQTHR